MTGRHRMPEPDGRTAGATLLGAVAVGLGLVASIVSTDLRATPHPIGQSRLDVDPGEPAAFVVAARADVHTCRCGPRTIP
ncbi:hypothetical protein ACIRU3_07140 [Streptomyces sp. NPDC101151]|uniref:hypothetical protein n=1 Tax=Streptomyces sp. NPDC101151 TaxID=3366115 RepID=UPI00380A5612